jgi:hypothetical protein
MNTSNIDSQTPNFWMERIKCYELKQIMRQNDEEFINILNRFQTTTQSQFDIDSISSQCFLTPPQDPKLPYLFYTNEASLNTMKQVSYKVMEMCTYFVQKIHVLNYFNCKMIQISRLDYI